jgi:hypothetical protein
MDKDCAKMKQIGSRLGRSISHCRIAEFRVSSKTSFVSKQPKLEPKLVLALSKIRSVLVVLL